MQRKNSPAKRTYVQSGIPGHSAPGGRKPNKTRQIIQLVIISAIVLMVCILAVFGLSRLFGRANDPKLISAQATDNIQPFGENLLCYNGMTLTCFGPNGSTRWAYQLGMDADYSCSKDMIVAWSGNQIHVLDKGGSPTFTDRLDGTIRFARVGETYVTACIGTEANCTVRVMNHTGGVVENYPFDGLYVVDTGFFSTKGQLVWILGLDVAGNAPITNLSTYQPGHLVAGKVDINNKMVYQVYLHNNLLMLVDTNKITAYNYKCVEQLDVDPVLIYGWHVKDVRAVGKNTYALLQQLPTTGDSSTFSELRLVENNSRRALRLLSPCFASGLSEKGVYGFGSNVIYYAPYGTGTFKATYLTFTITDFICMLDGGRMVFTTSNGVFIMKLPT